MRQPARNNGSVWIAASPIGAPATLIYFPIESAVKDIIRSRVSANQRSSLLLLCVQILLSAGPAFAQARINPDLPAGSQPLVKTRILLLVPDNESVPPPQIPHARLIAPLSVKQKFQLFSGESFDPSILVVSAALAGISQAGNFDPKYGLGGAAYAKRFGASTASLATASFFAQAAMPALFHQDPRYFRKGTGSIAGRFWYAISRVALTQSDRGNTEFNYSLIGGLATSTALANSYYPRVSRTVGVNAIGYGIDLGIAAGLNILEEFGHLGRHAK
jgi:hypothetical protein